MVERARNEGMVFSEEGESVQRGTCEQSEPAVIIARILSLTSKIIRSLFSKLPSQRRIAVDMRRVRQFWLSRHAGSILCNAVSTQL